MHEPSVRVHAAHLQMETVQPDDDWWKLSRRLQVPLVQLRFYNPFLAARTLRPGNQVVYPVQARKGLFDTRSDAPPQYRTRLGDNYIKLAYTLGVDLDALRDSNALWRLEPLLPGTLLTIPFGAAGNSVAYRVADGDDLSSIAERMRVDPWWIVRDNSLWDDQIRPGMVLNIRALPPPPEYAVHRVRAGENLTSIAERYGTTVGAIQRANALRGTRILVGQQLRIPSRS
jgi:LysM repeat protein